MGHFQRYGGNSWLIRIYRSWFELKTTLSAMWMGNPILTMVLFGLPAGFLSLICYGICCPDILDADDDEEGINLYCFTVYAVLNLLVLLETGMLNIHDSTQLP